MGDALHSELIPSDEEIAEARIGVGQFAEIGQIFVDLYIRESLLKPDYNFVDIGCGLGRIARPIVDYLSDRGRYYGYDVKKSSIDWCRHKYKTYRNFEFRHIDVRSVIYNPLGSIEAEKARFPLQDRSADLISLTSVFTHMYPRGAAAYLKEIARLLRPGRSCFITYFLIDPESAEKLDFTDLSAPVLGSKSWHRTNGCYVRNREFPEEVTLLEEQAVRKMYADAGLEIVDVRYGGWLSLGRGPKYGENFAQDSIIARKKA